MLHAVPRNDKKKRKEVQEQIAKLEAEMKSRHTKEEENCNKEANCSGVQPTAAEKVQENMETSNVDPVGEENGGKKKSRQQRRKVKHASLCL